MANSESFKKTFDPADFGCCRLCCEPLPDTTAEVCPSCGGDPMKTRMMFYTFMEKHDIRDSHKAMILLKKVNGKIIGPDQYLEFGSTGFPAGKC